ncbi:MAG: hypothetical protein AAF628_26940 [Planctomycetota bacterium]
MLQIAVALSLLVVPAEGGSAERTRDECGEQRQSPRRSADEIHRLRRELLRTGPEARRLRERAIAQLLALDEARAHDVLQEQLHAGADPDRVTEAILRQLLSRFRHPADGVLGHAADGAGAAARRSSYVPALARVLGGVEVGSSRWRLARECLLTFAPWERLAAFRGLLAPGGEEAMRLAAVRAAGECQDLSLAQAVARLLGAKGALGEAVDQALWKLTFRDEPFGSVAAFDAWYDAEGSRSSFVDLAERAARRAHDERVARGEELRDGLERASLELVEAYVRGADIQWRPLRERLFMDEPPGTTRACLVRLAELLRGQEAASGDAAERATLFAALGERLAESQSVAERAALLEVCGALAAPGEEAQREQAVEWLLAGTRAADVAERGAALAGLAQLPSPRTRQALVQVGQRALASGDRDLLGAALDALHAKGWTAPAPGEAGRAAWLKFVEDTLRASELPFDTYRGALATLSLRDPAEKRVPEAFGTLSRLVRGIDRDPGVRVMALLQLADLATDDTSGDTYRQLVASSLEDPAAELRARAAGLLAKPPPRGTAADRLEWSAEMLKAATPRLSREPEAAVHEALIDGLKKLAGQGGDPARVIEALVQAGQDVVADATGERQPFHKKNLADALRVLASHPDRPVAQWLPACQVLLALDERPALRFVLSRHEDARTLEHGGVGETEQRVAYELTLRAALLRAPGEPWNGGAGGGEDIVAEADAVLAAAQALAAAPLLEEPAVVALLMAIHGDRAEHGRVVQLAEALRRGSTTELEHALQRRVAMRAAASHLALRQPAAARGWLLAIPRNGIESELLVLLERTIEALSAKGEFAAAVPLAAELVARTPVEAAELPERVLRQADVLRRVDAASAADALQLLLGHAELFDGGDTAAPLRQRYKALLAQLRGTG